MAEVEDKSSITHLEHPSKSFSGSFEPHTPPILTPEEEARAWRKVDMRLMPILALLYLFSFLDRGASYRSSLSIHVSPNMVGNIG
jgi:hypothetical protein